MQISLVPWKHLEATNDWTACLQWKMTPRFHFQSILMAMDGLAQNSTTQDATTSSTKPLM